MELNGIANLKILLDDIRQGADILKDSSSNEIVKKALIEDINSLDQQVNYLHAYLNEIFELIRVYEIEKSVPKWHQIRAKVDQNETT